MSFAMCSYQQAKTISARVFTQEDRAILHFDGDGVSEIALHLPPAVAEETARAFNEAMAKHNEGAEA